MVERRASCSCGKLVLVCRGDPVRVSMCHCFACQQRTGSAFGVQARFPAAAVAIQGEPTEYVRTGDSGGRVKFRFCPTCGSTVCWEIESLPGFVAVALGAFADPSFPPPVISVYEDRRHPWLVLPESITEHWD